MSIMDKYSDIFGIDIKEVKQWVNGYVSLKNWPEEYPIESAKEERINSIKEYMQSQVDESITGQIKASIIGERIAKSEAKVIAVCPF